MWHLFGGGGAGNRVVMNDSRVAVVDPLVVLAGSADYRDRADAGCAPASFADVDQARETLLELVLDLGDTFVTRSTATALLRRGGEVAYRIVSRALDAADGQPRWSDAPSSRNVCKD